MSVSALSGTGFTGVGTPMLGVDDNNILTPFRNSTDQSATNEVNVPAAATDAVLSWAAEANIAHLVGDIAYSYSAAPTGGRLTVKDGATDVIFDVDITAAGPGPTIFPGSWKQGHVGRAMTVTLFSGAGAVVGKLNAKHKTTSGVPGGAFDFGDEMNSGLLLMLF